MTLLIGTDEAGYGPNLGPLVVAASAWRLPDADKAADRLARMAAEIGAAAGSRQAPWADSKQLYKPGSGLGAIERGVLAALASTALASSAQQASGGIPSDGAALSERLGIDNPVATAPVEWPRFMAMTIPVATSAESLVALANSVATILPSQEIQLVAVACRLFHPAAFNALLDTGLNKSDIPRKQPSNWPPISARLPPGNRLWCGATDTGGGNRMPRSSAGISPRPWSAPSSRPLPRAPTRSLRRRCGSSSPSAARRGCRWHWRA